MVNLTGWTWSLLLVVVGHLLVMAAPSHWQPALSALDHVVQPSGLVGDSHPHPEHAPAPIPVSGLEGGCAIIGVRTTLLSIAPILLVVLLVVAANHVSDPVRLLTHFFPGHGPPPGVDRQALLQVFRI